MLYCLNTQEYAISSLANHSTVTSLNAYVLRNTADTIKPLLKKNTNTNQGTTQKTSIHHMVLFTYLNIAL